MTTTANDIIAGSLRVISSLTPGEAVPGVEATNAFQVLNWMLAEWSAKNLMIPYKTTEALGTLTSGKAQYTIGTSGSPDFNTARPDYITYAYRRDSNSQDYELFIIPQEEYSKFQQKTLTGLPQWLFYDPQYPNGQINLYPTDVQADTLYIESFKPLTQFASLSTALNLPGEYQNAMKYLLSEKLAPEYGFTITPDIRILIQDARQFIMKKNVRPKAANFDLYLLKPRPFNIYTG